MMLFVGTALTSVGYCQWYAAVIGMLSPVVSRIFITHFDEIVAAHSGFIGESGAHGVQEMVI